MQCWFIIILKPMNIEFKLISEIFWHISKTDDHSYEITLIDVVAIIIIIVLNQVCSSKTATWHFHWEVLECILVENILQDVVIVGTHYLIM